jgi:chromate reductase, NAD(P)H dehydrogenase (quinone)
MKVVAICGSLRDNSSNRNALEAMSLLGLADVDVYEGLGNLPHFNPDLDADGATPPPAVADLRERLRASDGVIISTPEYAHGVPGSLKNMLDWLVSDGLLVDKRVLIVNATPPSTYAHASLIETLTVMNWRVVATVEIPLRGKKLDAKAIAADPDLAAKLRSGIVALLR